MVNKKIILIIFFGIITCDQNDQHFRTSLTAKLSQKARLPCFVENGHKFIWMKTDQNEVISVGEIVMKNSNSLSIETECGTEFTVSSGCWVYLLIDNLELKDEGVYVCQKDTMQSSYINLTILVPPYIKNEAESSMDIDVIEGKDVELLCDAFGKPNPNIKWFAKNEYYITSQKVLIIKNVSRNSIKEYECIADNGVDPSISRTFSLRILFPPSIIEFEVDKFNKSDSLENFKLVVKFSGYPIPKFKWVIDGDFKNSSIDLDQFSNDSKRDSNVFCSSINIKNLNRNSLIEFKIENELGTSNSSFRLKNIPKYTTRTRIHKFFSDKKRTILSNSSVKNISIGHKTLISNLKLNYGKVNKASQMKLFSLIFFLILYF